MKVAPGKPVRIVNVASKMHELAVGLDPGDPHLARPGAFASVTAYSQSKLAQVTTSCQTCQSKGGEDKRRVAGESMNKHPSVVHVKQCRTVDRLHQKRLFYHGCYLFMNAK